MRVAVTAFDVSRCQCRTAGQVNDAWLAGRQFARRAGIGTGASQMMLLPGRGAGGRTNFAPKLVIVGTTSRRLTSRFSSRYFYRMFESGRTRRRSAQWMREYVPQQPVHDAMDAFGFQGSVRIVSNACASGTNALACLPTRPLGPRAARLCGGYDALCQSSERDLLPAGRDRGKMPAFDPRRSGRARRSAAVFLLEALGGRDTSVLPRSALRRFDGHHHLTQPNPDAAARASHAGALADAGWTEPIRLRTPTARPRPSTTPARLARWRRFARPFREQHEEPEWGIRSAAARSRRILCAGDAEGISCRRI